MEENKSITEVLSSGFIAVGYIDAPKMAEVLLKKRYLKIHLTNVEKLERRRIIDFLTGMVFALEGKVEKIDDFSYQFIIN
ncbi:cell division protein SepF [Spiroplasma endosymbiont of Anurida maritima]|uniref:cell division protein SepF n=1 Tax=Spiroplasma endosymbiont of Anurida maritima TaxID=2967972 RepID=UPI0036D31A97